MKKILILSVISLFSVSLPVFACEGEDHQVSEKKVEFKLSSAKSPSVVKIGHNFSVKGMSCQSCVNKVTKAIQGVNGVKSVKVDLKNESALVVLKDKKDLKKVSVLIAKAVEKSGFKIKLSDKI